jgi:hypothetical protein
MMGAARVPEGVKCKVALEAIACATQLDGLVVVDVKGKMATRDVHMFGANPLWSSKLKVWAEAGIVAEGKDAKTGDRGTTMMFVGYADRESDSVRMWDMQTSRVIVIQDVYWLKCMFFNDDATGVIDLYTLEDLESESGVESDTGVGIKNEDDITKSGPNNNQPNWSGGTVTWSTPLVTGPGTGCTRVSPAIKPPDRLTYAPAVELRYLGEMAELDHGEQANTYMALQSMEVALIGAGVGGGGNWHHAHDFGVVFY